MLKCGEKLVSQIETQVIDGADVLVSGGGTAGVVAALAAARTGADVMLVERNGFLGGMLTAGNAGMTMFTKYSGSAAAHSEDEILLAENPAEIQIVGGIVKEITERLLRSGVGIGNNGTFGSYVFTSSEDFKRLLFQMMKEEKVKLRLHSMITDVVQDNGVIKGIITESKSGRQLIPAKQFIDATGDGDVAMRSGVPFTVGVTENDLCAKSSKIGEMSPMGVMFKVGNVDLMHTFDWLGDNQSRFAEHLFARLSFKSAKARFEKGEMAVIGIKSEFNPTWLQVYNLPLPGIVTLCCPCVFGDGCNVEDLTRAEMTMADMVDRWMKNIKTIPGFENSSLLDCPEIGVRETRHIQGEYVLNLMDIYKQKKFDDCIGFGSHPIDTRPRPEWLNDPETAYPPRWYFQIPYRCLIAKGMKNLLVAGRCISATHEAFGCIRPTVQCMITGEAAGTAAALCVKENSTSSELNINLLIETLKRNGVLL